MLRVNLAKLEEQMRILSEDRTRSVAGDAPMLTIPQTAKVWSKTPSWVRKMMREGRVPTVPWGGKTGVPRAVVIMGLVKGL
jgi:hypothetical protein